MDVSHTADRFTPLIRWLALMVLVIVLLGAMHNFILSGYLQSASLHPLSAIGYGVAALGLWRRPHALLTLAQGGGC
ncbi:hypothetical protein CKO11_15665 [Rhodobacter sp. TJ_12]|uniref:hypothetical protein n=1 Tax=Rhodobacter sp. TJ_12 TaxID=2029399 RepID=UPI001CC0F89E|nr:hypothetical protein [Rhodobacter sp. TJ_12]MBZ4023890.1 hypothetical protein [Rhodobacter sp. TJ_12]